MEIGKLSASVEPLRELLYQQEKVLAELKKRSGKQIVGLVCDMLPVEVLASFDLIPVRLLPIVINRVFGCSSIETEIEFDMDRFDRIIVSDRCCKKSNIKKGSDRIHIFNTFNGYGEEASIKLHGFLDKLLKDIGLIGIKNIDIKRLTSSAREYDTLRRLVRGICSMRMQMPDMLSNEDMSTIFTAGQCLPPEVIIKHFSGILDLLKNTESMYDKSLISSLVYGGMIESGNIFDEIEKSGLLVAEDDSCNGRRQFDISLNADSEYLYYEILDAFSYRPLCPSLRSARERFELLYKLLKNYNIEVVVFISSDECKQRKEQIDWLRKKLMRLGIDQIIISKQNASSVVEEYATRVKKIKQITNVSKR